MSLRETAIEAMTRLSALDRLDCEDYRETAKTVGEILKEYPLEVLKEINSVNNFHVVILSSTSKEECVNELASYIAGRMETVDSGYMEIEPSLIGEMRRAHNAEKLQIPSAKFTAGEWEYYRSFGVIVGTGNRPIAQVNDAGEDEHCCKLTEEGQANAKLIAHAPEIYNLLVRILEATTDPELRGDILSLIWDINGRRK